jgi:hypothetical protein
MTYVNSGSKTTARPEQAVLVGVHDSLHPVPQLEPIQHPADVCLDRGLGQEELGSEVGVGQARGDLDEDLLFAGGERVEPGRRRKAELPACGRCGRNESSSLRVTPGATTASPGAPSPIASS